MGSNVRKLDPDDVVDHEPGGGLHAGREFSMLGILQIGQRVQ